MTGCRFLAAGLRRLAESGFETSGKAREEVAKLDGLASDGEFRTKLMHEPWGDPLFLLMAAVEATHRGIVGALALTRTAVARAVANRQVVFLTKGTDGPERRLRLHLAVCANLCGGLTKEQVPEVAEEEAARLRLKATGGVGWQVDQLADRLGFGDREDWVLRRYDPDWLAEAFLLEAGCDAGTVRQMARRDLGAVVQIVRLTARNLDSNESGREEHRPVRWLESLLADDELTYGMLLGIESALEMNTPTTVLRVVWVKLYQRALLQVDAANEAERARLLNNLSICQSAVGDRKGALASIREAVELRRQLHGANPDAFAPDLARSLNNLSICQSGVGDPKGALASSLESVELYWHLHGGNPDAFCIGLGELAEQPVN